MATRKKAPTKKPSKKKAPVPKDKPPALPAPPPGMFVPGQCIICNGLHEVCNACGEANCDCDSDRVPCICQDQDSGDSVVPNHLSPSLKLLSALGSIIVHFDEGTSAAGVQLDIDEARRRMAEPEVQQWFKAMGPLLPLKRSQR